MNIGRKWVGWLRGGVPFALILTAWALGNRLASLFEFMPGVTFFFPAAAVTAVGTVWLGPWAALAVWTANFLSPWGAAVGTLRTGVFGLPEVVFCLLLVSALRRAHRWHEKRLSGIVFWGLACGTMASALLGTVLLHLLPPPGFTVFPGKSWVAFFSWWFSDLVAASTLGLAGMVLVRPQALLRPSEELHFRQWWRRSGFIPVGLGSLAAAALVWVLAGTTGAKPHWLVPLFLPAIAVAAFQGGTGAALVTNGWVSALHLASVVGFGHPNVGQVTAELVTTYVQLLLVTSLAWLLGSQAAANRQLVQQVERQKFALEEALEQIALLLAQTLESRERGSRGHAQRVAELSLKVAQALNLPAEEQKKLRRAALLHDIGKVGVGEGMLNQPVELTGEGRDQLRRLLWRTVANLQRVELLREVLAIVEAVGERWDGKTTGEFPGRLGLQGEEIPLAARIIAAVRAYDAMTHPKPWRPARTREEAVAELWRCSGSQFDPQVVKVLTEILRERWDLEMDRLAG
ncbi:MAG: HD domain-containing protein [Thermoanaerobaculum sp.]|nr:HD domain-containing protein [Thermoanaerobaculum sp.]